MSESSVPERVKIRLWGKTAGRCQYEGCNRPLWIDSLTKAEFNVAYLAHIIADKEDGPRGDPVLSKQRAHDISNLMLMCDEHHRLIDREDVDGHTVDRLKKMKAEHEQRIELLTAIHQERQSVVVLYAAHIGTQGAHVSFDGAALAMSQKGRFPASKPGIELSLQSSFEDHETDFWTIESENLRREFATKILPICNGPAASNDLHFSVFGFAPMPLLIELGRCFSDIRKVDVYQLHKEPQTWAWQEDYRNEFEYEIVAPEASGAAVVAVNLSLSADIDKDRIEQVLGSDAVIWKLTHPNPNTDYLRSEMQLTKFRQEFRRLLELVKMNHGMDAEVHLFLAVPVSVAVEIGRVWQPKAHPTFHVYDQNRKQGGFNHALTFEATT